VSVPGYIAAKPIGTGGVIDEGENHVQLHLELEHRIIKMHFNDPDTTEFFFCQFYNLD